jgi:predicted transcriptional regulator
MKVIVIVLLSIIAAGVTLTAGIVTLERVEAVQAEESRKTKAAQREQEAWDEFSRYVDGQRKEK